MIQATYNVSDVFIFTFIGLPNVNRLSNILINHTLLINETQTNVL